MLDGQATSRNQAAETAGQGRSSEEKRHQYRPVLFRIPERDILQGGGYDESFSETENDSYDDEVCIIPHREAYKKRDKPPRKHGACQHQIRTGEAKDKIGHDVHQDVGRIEDGDRDVELETLKLQVGVHAGDSSIAEVDVVHEAKTEI